MTYCLALKLDEGLAFCSDSRTNAGPDRVSTYSKMHPFDDLEGRFFTLLSAGNLATTQAVLTHIRHELTDNPECNLCKARYMDEVADYIGRVSREQQKRHMDAEGVTAGFSPAVSFILGGQIGDDPHEIFLVYPQGNHITTSVHTRFLQIGESKYGKPILDRILKNDTPLETVARPLSAVD